MPQPDHHQAAGGEPIPSGQTSPPAERCCRADTCGPAGPGGGRVWRPHTAMGGYGIRTYPPSRPTTRRDFIKLAGASAASLAAAHGIPLLAAERDPGLSADHFVPVDKNLAPKWIKMLSAKGGSTWYSGSDLDTIAMPIGGICTGQVYLTGDGRLTHWDVFNKLNFSGYGSTNYELGRKPQSPLRQGFALRVKTGEKTLVRSLDRRGFPGVRFCGEYPMGTVEYQDDGVPVSVRLEAFSPLIPLSAEDSALPATVMQFTVKNTSDAPAEVTLAGWLENGVCPDSGKEMDAARVNRVVRRGDMTMILGEAKATKAPKTERPPIVLADFEGQDYGDWKVEGKAFGKGPAGGTILQQQEVSGFQGKGLVNTYLGGSDQATGKLTSPEFTIQRRFVSFLIGGGSHAKKTCINLLVDGKVVHTAEGRNNERLQWHNWNVADLAGKQARIEIVDQETAGWGHINIDQIELRDTPRPPRSGPLDAQSDFGTMGLALLGPAGGTLSSRSLPDGPLPDVLFSDDGLAATDDYERPFGQRLCGALGERRAVGPGQQTTITFVAAWHFPNRPWPVGDGERPKVGNYYANRFPDAAAVAEYLAKNFDRLAGQTRLWHATWYDSTLPHWLLDRLFSTVSTLATSTCQWWANGRFWAWEGVGCCHGTCAHVWNYEHAMARLFPQLERSVREMQDYDPDAGFVSETGMIRFRGEGWGMWAGDGQAGTVLKAYREHQVSADAEFLKRLWPKIRKSLEFLVREDRNADGLIEGSQHNTYDIEFYGANTMVGSLYLAALRAAEEMARELGEVEFARTCRKIFEKGSELSVEQLFNGEYFIQKVDLAEHPKFQYDGGCLSDQLFGQGWAHQVGLGYVYPEEHVAATLKAIWKYNWAPDVGPQNKAHPPERWFARPGEAGLFTCTWPHSKHLQEGVRYKNEIWTGIEYQVAGHLAWERMVTEALAICRGVHERYHPSKHNPWNEIECGDHYARAMAAHGVFLGLCGFEYHGPKTHLGFAPRISPEDFRAAFTAAEGWGTLAQKRTQKTQTNRVEIKWGELRLKTLAFELPEGAKLDKATVAFMGSPVQAEAKQLGRRVNVALAVPAVVEQGQAIDVEMVYRAD
jgi:non-lysosomal glucosylceramidase